LSVVLESVVVKSVVVVVESVVKSVPRFAATGLPTRR
jgi:hypothetical protein